RPDHRRGLGPAEDDPEAENVLVVIAHARIVRDNVQRCEVAVVPLLSMEDDAVLWGEIIARMRVEGRRNAETDTVADEAFDQFVVGRVEEDAEATRQVSALD